MDALGGWPKNRLRNKYWQEKAKVLVMIINLNHFVEKNKPQNFLETCVLDLENPSEH